MKLRASKKVVVLFAGALLAACNGNVLNSSIPKHERPVPNHLVKAMKSKGMTLASPIMLRIFKEENVMEVWKQDNSQRYALLNSYEICKWSGKLGPKYQEGDRQAPEGFYHVTKGLMNPNSSFHLSFNLGFPNKFDRANDRTGSYLMVHGDCSSAGCYSMTDEFIEEIYALAREAFKGGQKAFQVQAFPFKMTADNMAKKVNHPKFEFWKMLKEGNDHFEVTNKQPKVDVCEKRYVFNRVTAEGDDFNSRLQCPPTKTSKSLALAFNQKQTKDQEIFDKILKRTVASPFVKPEDKPFKTNISIRANPTIGALSFLEPATPKLKPASAITTPVGVPTAKPAPVVTTNQVQNQVSGSPQPTVPSTAAPSSIAPTATSVIQQGAQVTATQTPVISSEVSKVAVPQPALRPEPQS